MPVPCCACNSVFSSVEWPVFDPEPLRSQIGHVSRPGPHPEYQNSLMNLGGEGQVQTQLSSQGWAQQPDAQKQPNKSGQGTPNPSRLRLLLLTGPGSRAPLGQEHSLAKSLRVMPGHQDCLCSRGGCEKRPSGLVTQTSLTPSWVGTFQRLCLFLDLAPGLSTE